jgi:ubiquinone/menaquinone biosynthesis C-methylase UbiE
LSYALLKQEDFKGRIIALDLSLGMLEQAASKLSLVRERSHSDRSVEFLRHLSLPLPFPDAAFDAVCALEVLELFPNMDEPLAELTRVLRPGGMLLTSRGTEESGRKARVKSAKELTALLEGNKLKRVQITRWWKYFDRVIAIKHGDSQPVTRKGLSSVLKCSACQASHWSKESSRWQCQNCGKELTITKTGIVLN